MQVVSPVALHGVCIVASRSLGGTPPTGSTGTGLLRLLAGGGLLHILVLTASWSHLPVETGPAVILDRVHDSWR